ncbi:MAG: peptidylprolyl isomerase [Vicinamibacterales bacterium]
MRRLAAVGGAVAIVVTLATVPGRLGAAAGGQPTAIPAPGLIGVLAVEDARAPVADDLRALLVAARSNNVGIQRAAVRALGRLERREVITDLLPYLQARDPQTADEAASALALAMRGPALAGSSPIQPPQAILDALIAAPARDAMYRAAGRVPYANLEQARQAERYLRSGLTNRAPAAGAARGLESLARLQKKFLPFEDLTLERLRAIATSREQTYPPDLRRMSLAALVASLGADTLTVVAAVKDADPEVRRLAMLSLAGASTAIDSTRRVDLLQAALADRSSMVRLEALKGWVRRGVPMHGCGLVLDAVADQDLIVSLYALDALADQCQDDIVVTDRLTAESRTPPASAWHREAHAFVALARRAPDRAALIMPAFAGHQRWQVRMYAGRAAGSMNDTATLTRLAFDSEDNVREATLAPLRRLQGTASDDAFVAALARPDYQLLRTAARELKGTGASPTLASALATALTRVTAEQKETSRDPRMAIVERLTEVGSATESAALRPLLRDFDPVVANIAATLLRSWTNEELVVDPQRLPRAPLPSSGELAEDVQAVVTMAGGRTFTLQFETAQAPLTRSRFVRLARSQYYDGLTFHRAVANAFLQGGSPGANEYAGDRLYLRDEVGLEMHTRGSVGISTRGRDTGDAQIFINLVDNPFLDYEYTVFARVCGDGMETVDRIQEGDRIERIQIEKTDGCR